MKYKLGECNHEQCNKILCQFRTKILICEYIGSIRYYESKIHHADKDFNENLALNPLDQVSDEENQEDEYGQR